MEMDLGGLDGCRKAFTRGESRLFQETTAPIGGNCRRGGFSLKLWNSNEFALRDQPADGNIAM